MPLKVYIKQLLSNNTGARAASLHPVENPHSVCLKIKGINEWLTQGQDRIRTETLVLLISYFDL